MWHAIVLYHSQNVGLCDLQSFYCSIWIIYTETGRCRMYSLVTLLFHKDYRVSSVNMYHFILIYILPVHEGRGCDHVPFDLQWMYTHPRRSYPGSQLNINTEAKSVPLPSLMLTFPLVGSLTVLHCCAGILIYTISSEFIP